MIQIFISYSRKDEIFARQLATALSNLSADIWIDIEDIPAGMKWSSAIQQGLDSADALVVIISPESMKSRNVEDEWQYFLDNGKTVIPILLRESKVHFQLNRIQWIDFKNQPFDVALLDLHGELQRNGIHLDAPPKPDTDVKPLSHGHAPPPEPKSTNQSNQTMLYAGVAGVIVLIILVIAFTMNGNGNDNTTATLDAQNTRLAELEALTETIQDVFEQQTQSAQAQNQVNTNATATQLLANQIATQNQLETEQSIPTATNTQPPTTSTMPPTATNPPIILGPVSDNSQWSSIELTIDGVQMVLVPSGSFTLGTSQEHFDANLAVCMERLNESSCRNNLGDEFNGAEITINEPYWIDKYEVSEALYGSSNSDYPQVEVSSRQAQQHCESRGGSLPNEAEWEFAAKGASNWRFPWGDTWDLTVIRSNTCDVNCSNSWAEPHYNDGYPESSPVTEIHGSESWVGAYNMVGNVWEWTSDSYAPDTTNTLRGGSWTWVHGESTTTARSAGIAQITGFYGFRCVRPYVDGDLERYSE